jgi:hypothetical protein
LFFVQIKNDPIEREIYELQQKAEKLGEEGNVDAYMEITRQIEALKQKKFIEVHSHIQILTHILIFKYLLIFSYSYSHSYFYIQILTQIFIKFYDNSYFGKFRERDSDNNFSMNNIFH